MKKKIAIVNQRYGTEVNGGSEYYTKKLAEHLQEYYDIEVLTTTALDYDTWEPYYSVGLQEVDGVSVRRFPVKRPRNIKRFKIINKLVRMLPFFWKVLEPIWVREQGPYCPELVRYIKEQKDEFDVFIFVTYLYYTTAVGLPEVAEKAILVPTAHDEYCIYFHVYLKIFQIPKTIVYLTEEEKSFVERVFHNGKIPSRVAGAGIEVFESTDKEFRRRYQIDSDYLIYVGRVDTCKKCDVLFEYYTRLIEKKQTDLKLIVVGKLMMNMPKAEGILCLGFVSESDKYSAIAGAKALIMPSEHESLSLVVLEAMAMGIPVVVNGECAVLMSHCENSGAGFSYKTFDQFENEIETLLNDKKQYQKMQFAGKKYVYENYTWDKTVMKYRELIEL